MRRTVMPRDVGPVMIWAVWSARWLRRHAYVLEFRSDHGRDCPDAGVNPRLACAAASALAERRTCLLFVPKPVGRQSYVWGRGWADRVVAPDVVCGPRRGVCAYIPNRGVDGGHGYLWGWCDARSEDVVPFGWSPVAVPGRRRRHGRR